MVSNIIVYSNYYRNSYLAEDESICEEKFKKSNIKYIFIRPTMIFGSKKDGNISRFIRWFCDGQYFQL